MLHLTGFNKLKGHKMVSALNFKSYESGAICGFFDLRYHGSVIKDCRLMRGNNGGHWLALPQKKGEKDGETKYFDIIYLTKPEAEHVRNLVIAQLKAEGHIDGGPQGGSGVGRGYPEPPTKGSIDDFADEDLSAYGGVDDDVPF
jgi:DNA-binding cell septation regulator SpoVG